MEHIFNYRRFIYPLPPHFKDNAHEDGTIWSPAPPQKNSILLFLFLFSSSFHWNETKKPNSKRRKDEKEERKKIKEEKKTRYPFIVCYKYKVAGVIKSWGGGVIILTAVQKLVTTKAKYISSTVSIYIE